MAEAKGARKAGRRRRTVDWRALREVARSLVDPASWVSNPWSKVLSLVLAVATWLYVQGGEITEDRLQVPISWVLPNELLALEPLPPFANVAVRGTRAAVHKAQREPLRLLVDTSGFASGSHAVDLDPVPLEGLPAGLERLSTAPPTVEFVLERPNNKTLEIVTVLVGEPAAGHAVGSVVPDPLTVKVRGPSSVLSTIRQLSTRPIDVTDASEDFETDAPLDLPYGVELVVPVAVRARVSISASTERRTVDSIPIYVWGHEGWRVEPSVVSVEVEGPATRIRQLESSELAAFVYLPRQPDLDRYEVSFGPKDGPRIAVLELSGSGVVPVGTFPAAVVASREPAVRDR